MNITFQITQRVQIYFASSFSFLRKITLIVVHSVYRSCRRQLNIVESLVQLWKLTFLLPFSATTVSVCMLRISKIHSLSNFIIQFIIINYGHYASRLFIQLVILHNCKYMQFDKLPYIFLPFPPHSIHGSILCLYIFDFFKIF